MDNYFSIGKRVRELRLQNHLSQEQLALTAEITTAYLGQIERNEKNPTVSVVAKLCNALGIQLSEFFSEEPLPQKNLDPITMQILYQLKNQDEDVKIIIQEQGLDVEFTTPGGPKGFQAMHAGDCDFSMLSQEPLLIAQEQGIESKVLVAMLQSRIYGIVSGPDITDLSQLKGKVIFGGESGSAGYTFTCYALELAGLDPLNDVEYVQISDQNSGLQALLNGEVAAAYLNVSNLPVLGDFDYNLLVDCTDPQQCEKYLGSSDFPAEMLCATSEYVKENPEICQKVVNAVIDAENWIAEHSDGEVAASLNPLFGELDEEIIEQEIALIRDNFSTDGMVSEAGQEAVIAMCIKAGLISTEIPYDEVIDMTFVNNYDK